MTNLPSDPSVEHHIQELCVSGENAGAQPAVGFPGRFRLLDSQNGQGGETATYGSRRRGKIFVAGQI
eukprot:m.25501 g.25501  ORF g.25501 m.25501 type:complete len:67 (-) comp4436_c0_seq2:120-320(-)